MSKFIKRNNFRLKKPKLKVVKDLNILERDVQNFILEIQDLLNSGNYDEDFVLNFDETSIQTEMIRSKTIDTKEINPHTGFVKTLNKTKETLTVGLCGSYSGVKLPAFVIIEGLGVKKLNYYPGNISITYSQKSFMNQNLMKIWLLNVLRPFATDLPHNKKGLLILDGATAHCSKDVLKIADEVRFDVKFLPPNTTAHLQPMDLTVNNVFKNIYSNFYEDYLLAVGKNQNGNLKAPSREEKVDWISRAWKEISSDVVQNGFDVYRKNMDIRKVSLEEKDEEEGLIIEEMLQKDKEIDILDQGLDFLNFDILDT